MATYNMVNVRSGTSEPAKYATPGEIVEIWQITTTTILANGDILQGPILPAGCYLLDVTTDCTALGGSCAFSVGYTGQAAAFIPAGTNAAVAGGLGRMASAGSLGFTATTDTRVLITMTAAAAANGTVKLAVEYTANP